MPELHFVYSWLYDKMLRQLLGLRETDRVELYNRASRRAKVLQTYWNKHARRVFKTIEEVTRLPWKHDEVLCYIVAKLPQSTPTLLEPLTLTSSVKEEKSLGLITHELIHQNFEHNRLFPWVLNETPLMRKYATEKSSVKLHIPVCAVLDRVLPLSFEQSRVQKFRNPYAGALRSRMKRAWQIVIDEGAETILKGVIWKSEI